MPLGIGYNFGDGIDAGAVQPPALADDDYLERYLSEQGIHSFADHDATDDAASSQDAAAVAAVVRDCKSYAGGLIAGRVAKRYLYSVLASCPMMQEIWAVVVLRTLCFRRGNPPPASLEFRYQEVTQKDGILDQIADGRFILTDESGNPIRPKNANAPHHANLQVDRRFPESQVRVVTGSSNIDPSALGRKLDRWTEYDR